MQIQDVPCGEFCSEGDVNIICIKNTSDFRRRTRHDMKKIIYLAISIMMMAMLTGCLSWPEADSVLIESDIPIDISNPTIPIPDDLQYFETIEEAIMNNDLELQNLSIDKRIKLFENDEYAVLFCRENGGGAKNSGIMTLK